MRVFVPTPRVGLATVVPTNEIIAERCGGEEGGEKRGKKMKVR